MERSTTIILILVIIIVLIGSGSASFSISAGSSNTEHLGLIDALNTNVKKTTGQVPSIKPTEHELATHARLAQVRQQNQRGVSEHMDDSMGERGEDALEVALKGGSGWDVFQN